MNALTGFLGHVPGPVAYVILAAAVLAESVLLVGAFIPTLSLLLASGALARAGDLNLALVIVTAASAVVAGDALGHRTGRLLGSRLRIGRLGRRVPAAAWDRTDALMARCGGQAVFLARFVPVIRTLMPHLAGAARLPYRRIAPYSLIAALLWAGVEAITGYAAADSLRRLITYGGPGLAAVVFLSTSAAVVALSRRRRARTRVVSAGSLVATPHTPMTPEPCRRAREPVPSLLDGSRGGVSSQARTRLSGPGGVPAQGGHVCFVELRGRPWALNAAPPSVGRDEEGGVPSIRPLDPGRGGIYTPRS
ncbi:DedA family protein [Streptomyces filamentosus]|uniref:VTT domain-containing protein n=1 Tax=Streptomyces filamentosus TaxID=67294 RepID=A0A919BQZ6_STRFL|nr:DedA family protein [Streptomyces filamentosus]GHG06691.1 hypothetical protein GCM10017667_42460 [Streptomyces filamentosus]